MFETIAAQVDFVSRNRVKHERVIGIGRMSKREDFGRAAHVEMLTAGERARKYRDFDCCLRCRNASDSVKHMAKSGLGKGLGALIGSRPPPVQDDIDLGEQVRKVRLTSIVPSPLQPRKD